MENITIIEVEGVEHIIIDHGNDQFTSMLKAIYDEQQAEHLNGIVDGKASTK